MSLNPSAAARFCPPPTATPYRKRLSKVPMRARSRSDNYAAVLRLQSTQPKDRRVYNAPYRILCITGDAAGTKDGRSQLAKRELHRYFNYMEIRIWHCQPAVKML